MLSGTGRGEVAHGLEQGTEVTADRNVVGSGGLCTTL